MNAAYYNAILPKNIAKLINQRGLKQGAVAERSGYSKQQFSDMLNGRKIIKVRDLMRIAEALELEPRDLFYETEKSKEANAKTARKDKEAG